MRLEDARKSLPENPGNDMFFEDRDAAVSDSSYGLSWLTMLVLAATALALAVALGG
jgi:hypothetical protein